MVISLIPSWLQEFEKEAGYRSKREEIHEHPYFNGQYHIAVWAQTWVSGETNDIEAPEGMPIICAICGKAKE